MPARRRAFEHGASIDLGAESGTCALVARATTASAARRGLVARKRKLTSNGALKIRTCQVRQRQCAAAKLLCVGRL